MPHTRPTRAFQRALSRRIARTRSATPGAAAPHHPRSGNDDQVSAPPATARARDHHREGTGEDYVSALRTRPGRPTRVSFVPDVAVRRPVRFLLNTRAQPGPPL